MIALVYSMIERVGDKKAIIRIGGTLKKSKIEKVHSSSFRDSDIQKAYTIISPVEKRSKRSSGPEFAMLLPSDSFPYDAIAVAISRGLIGVCLHTSIDSGSRYKAEILGAMTDCLNGEQVAIFKLSPLIKAN